VLQVLSLTAFYLVLLAFAVYFVVLKAKSFPRVARLCGLTPSSPSKTAAFTAAYNAEDGATGAGMGGLELQQSGAAKSPRLSRIRMSSMALALAGSTAAIAPEVEDGQQRAAHAAQAEENPLPSALPAALTN
jgi:hypothetical protein